MKMEIFVLVKKFLAKVGIKESSHERILYAKNFLIIIVAILCLSTNIVYFLHVATDFEEYVEITYAFSTAFICCGVYIILIWRKETAFKAINGLKQLINSRLANPISKTIYVQTIQRVEKWCYFINLGLVDITPCALGLQFLVIGFFSYFQSDLDGDAFELQFPTWMPFDYKNPLGYTMTIFIQLIFTYNAMCCGICMITFAMGSFLALLSLTDDLVCELNAIDPSVSLIKRNPVQMSQKMSEFVQFHSDSLQVFHVVSEVLQPALMILFAWGLVTISGVMLMMQLEINANNYTLIMVVLAYEMFLSFTILFFFCECGHRVNDGFNEICQALDQFDWYLLPSEMQKNVPTIMAGVQISVTFHSFGSIECVRETFKQIVNCAFSYFMVLRKFG